MTGPLKMDVGTRNTERKGVNGEDKKGLTGRREKLGFEIEGGVRRRWEEEKFSVL